METRRSTLGRRIKRARLAAGYRSQRAFAEAIGVHERSVARAETGGGPIGDTLLTAIETGLSWPSDSIRRYLDTGDEALLQASVEVSDEHHDVEPSEAEAEVDRSPPSLDAHFALLLEEIGRMQDRITAEMERTRGGHGGDSVAFNALVRDAENILDRARAVREEGQAG